MVEAGGRAAEPTEAKGGKDAHAHGHKPSPYILHGPLSLKKLTTVESLQFDEPWNEARRREVLGMDEKTKQAKYILAYVMDVLIGYT